MNELKDKYFNMVNRASNLKKFAEGLTITSILLYILMQMLFTTTFSTSFLMGLGGLFVNFIVWSVLLKTVLSLDQWMTLAGALLMAVVFFIVHKTNQQGLMLIYAWAIIGMVGISYRKYLKIHVCAVGALVFLAILASLTNVIPNLIFYQNYELRDSFGICYPTDFASYLFFLLLLFWIAWDSIPHWVSLVACIPLLAVAYVYARSDTSTICGVLFCVVLVAWIIWDRFPRKEIFHRFKKVFDVLLVSAFPLFGLLMFGLILLKAYNVGIGNTVDQILTGRLRLAVQSLRTNGIGFFGADVPMIGNGFSTFPVEDYNFVDSTYPLLLIKYGCVLSCLICLAWMRVTWIAVKNHDYRLALGMAFIAFHSLSEHHFIEVYYNAIIILLFADFTNKNPIGEYSKKVVSNKYILVVFGILLGFALTSPVWISKVRTICEWRELTNAGDGLVIVFVCLFMIVAFTKLCTIGIVEGTQWISKRKNGIKAITCLGLSVVLLLGGWLFSESLIKTAARDLKDRLETDAPALEKVSAASSGKVYASELPALYHQRFSNVRYHVYGGEDFAREKNATILTYRENEWNICLRKGFQFIPISDESALYSNDPCVVEQLQKDGYAAYQYYPETKEIKSGSDLDLVEGKYVIEYSLRVTGSETKDQPEEVAIIRILGNAGKDMLKTEKIFDDAMDGEGIISDNVILEIKKDTASVVFYLYGSGNGSVEVIHFSVRRIP